MTASITETSSTTRTLAVTLAPEAIAPAFEKKVEKYRKEVAMKGFRPGKVPRNILIQRFGDGIRQEAIDETINQVVKDELTAAQIKPVATGRLEDFQETDDKGISFKVVVEVDPPFDVQGWESLGVTVPPVVVNEAEIHDEVQALRRRLATEVPVERPAEKGDRVKGTYLSVIVDGEEQPLPADPAFDSVLGESSTPGFDDGLVGCEVGTQREVLFTYPADHKDDRYRGKAARFEVAIEEVFEITLPELDAEFFKKVGVEDRNDLESKISEGLAGRKQQTAKETAQEQALEELIRLNPVDVPTARVKHWIEHQFRQHMGEQEGMELPDIGDETIEALRPQAERELRKARILETLVTKMDIKVEQAQVDARIQEMADHYGIEFDKLKASLRQSGRIVNLREELKIGHVLDRLVGIQ